MRSQGKYPYSADPRAGTEERERRSWGGKELAHGRPGPSPDILVPAPHPPRQRQLAQWLSQGHGRLLGVEGAGDGEGRP